MAGVTAFYDRHPINEGQILAALAREGHRVDALRPEHLFAHDQDHYGGLAAVDRLIDAAHIAADSHVLDACAGMAGPARYIAHRTGAQVIATDLTTSRAVGAARLTRRVGLERRVHVVNADVTALPLADGSVDAVISQEAFLHVADKPTLFAELFRVLRPAGRLAFTDWLVFPGLEAASAQRLQDGIAARSLLSADAYRQAVAAAGFADVGLCDLSAEWQQILRERLRMYENMRADTVRDLGEETHRRYIDAYRFFVDRVSAGAVGGALITAQRPSRLDL